MYGNTITLMETGFITLIGMGTVFIVLILLVGVLSLFKFIPATSASNNNTTRTSSQTIDSIKVPTSSESITPLYKAIIMSAILEHQGSGLKAHQVRIKNIRKVC